MKEIKELFYMRTRFYNSEHGRFLSMDPHALESKLSNFYAYAYNNPVHFVDPKGIFAFRITKEVNLAFDRGYNCLIDQESTSGGKTMHFNVIHESLFVCIQFVTQTTDRSFRYIYFGIILSPTYKKEMRSSNVTFPVSVLNMLLWVLIFYLIYFCSFLSYCIVWTDQLMKTQRMVVKLCILSCIAFEEGKLNMLLVINVTLFDIAGAAGALVGGMTGGESSCMIGGKVVGYIGSKIGAISRPVTENTEQLVAVEVAKVIGDRVNGDKPVSWNGYGKDIASRKVSSFWPSKNDARKLRQAVVLLNLSLLAE